MKQLRSMVHDTRERIRLVSFLIFQSKGLKNKAVIAGYLLSNILSRIFRGMKQPEEIFIEMKEQSFWFAASQSELSPYPEICRDRVYEIDPSFIPELGDTVFDVGGHIGFFTIRQAKRVGSAGRVFVFEPNPATFSRLIRNVKVNDLRNVEAFNKAVTNRMGSITLKVSDRSSEGTTIMDNGTVPNYSQETQIATIALDDVADSYSLLKVDILKVDVEGAEVEVLLSGLHRAIPITRRIIVETHSVDLCEQVAKILKTAGFTITAKLPSGHNALGENHIVYASRSMERGL